MPALRWLALTALRSDRTSVRCVASAEALETVAHDRVTRRLPADGPGHTPLAPAWRPRFAGDRGALTLADAVLPTPQATALEGPARVSSSRARTPVCGLSPGPLVWTPGTRRMPLRLRRWRRGGPSAQEPALEWRSCARHRLRRRPASALCDARSPSGRPLRRTRA
jgi:hypothetical protein